MYFTVREVADLRVGYSRFIRQSGDAVTRVIAPNETILRIDPSLLVKGTLISEEYVVDSRFVQDMGLDPA